MKHPTVDDCKRLAQHYKCDALLVVAIHDGKGQVAGASWGRDKLMCKGTGEHLDACIAGIEETWPMGPKGGKE